MNTRTISNNGKPLERQHVQEAMTLLDQGWFVADQGVDYVTLARDTEPMLSEGYNYQSLDFLKPWLDYSETSRRSFYLLGSMIADPAYTTGAWVVA